MKKTNRSVPHSALPFLLGMLSVVGLYVITHLWQLTFFPVFADEAIYIRWAQLILDDWKQYLFFALNDGKTPLFIWMLAAAQSWSTDQLLAGRLVSVLGGGVQLLATWLILRQLKLKRLTQLLGVLLVVVLPFWFTYHRLAVMDGWLTAWLSLSFWAALNIADAPPKNRVRWVLLAGVTYGLALWTKLPALFFGPVFLVVPFLHKEQKFRLNQLIRLWWPYVASAGVGLLIFATLRLVPGFGQLFSRGQDFSYTFSEVLAGRWTESLANMVRFTSYFGAYLTWPILVLIFAGLFSARERRRVGLLILSALVFLIPFVVLGKVVHPRYLLPAALFLTIAAVTSMESLVDRCRTAIQHGHVAWVGIAILIALLTGQVFTYAVLFMSTFIFTPDNTPFVPADRQQYLEEWSSGHGIIQTVALLDRLTEDHSVAVATEGRFGTLPDGLLLYFHGQDVSNLYIEGTGQYPVKSLPEFFVERAKNFDQALLVANSHRMEISLPSTQLVAQFCRPNNAPCLQVWDVTLLVKAQPSSHTP